MGNNVLKRPRWPTRGGYSLTILLDDRRYGGSSTRIGGQNGTSPETSLYVD
jgi:hypothetical protein